jgi:hypothetical protein
MNENILSKEELKRRHEKIVLAYRRLTLRERSDAVCRLLEHGQLMVGQNLELLEVSPKGKPK